MWVHIWQREFSGIFLYVTTSSIQASAGSEPAQWKNITRKHAEDDAFNPGKLFIVLIFSALNPPSKHLSTYRLLMKLAFPQFFKRQTSLPPAEPDFDVWALQGTYPDKSAFRDVHTCSCLKIPHLVISYYMSCIPLSLTASFSQSWHSQLLNVQSTAVTAIWWLSDFNAWTPLPFLPLLINFSASSKGRTVACFLPLSSPPHVHIATQRFEILMLDQCMSGAGIHQLFKQGPRGCCTCSWRV